MFCKSLFSILVSGWNGAELFSVNMFWPRHIQQKNFAASLSYSISSLCSLHSSKDSIPGRAIGCIRSQQLSACIRAPDSALPAKRPINILQIRSDIAILAIPTKTCQSAKA
jgi:hypothetical protein